MEDSVVLVTTDGQIIERSTPVGGERFAQVRVIRDNATTEGRAAEGAESTELACEIATLGSDRLVVAMVGGAVEVLNRATGQTVHRMEAHQGLVRTMAVDQESERIVTGGIDRSGLRCRCTDGDSASAPRSGSGFARCASRRDRAGWRIRRRYLGNRDQTHCLARR